MNKSAILSGGFSPWQAPLAALFSGLSAAGQPGGFSNFGAGVQQGAQNFQQGQQNQQMMDLRRMQIEQAQEATRRANQEDAQRQAKLDLIQQALAGSAGSPTNTPVNQVGNYGAATGGIQTASGAPEQSAILGGMNPQQAALFSTYAQVDPEKAFQMLAEQSFAEPAEEKLTDDQREYQMAVDQGYDGTLLDFILGQKKASAATTTVNNLIGGDNKADAKLREELSKKEGERWSSLQESGTVSAGLQQDFEALDQLIGIAPSGPVEGRLAEAFPGFSSAGDAFQSIVVRVAPSLRTPGSGATSDIEYEGMLKSLPRLRNQPEANRAISEMMKAKAAINVERAAIVTAYQNEEITAADARRALKQLNDQSIMTPELKAALEGVGASGTKDTGGWEEVPGMPGVKVKRVP